MPIAEDRISQVAESFTRCCAEAQLLEYHLKKAIAKDIDTFANQNDQKSLLEILEKISLGQAKDILIGIPKKKHIKKGQSKKKHAEISECIGFYDFVKMQWANSGRSEEDLKIALKDIVSRRNHLAHAELVHVLEGLISIEDSLAYMNEAKGKFHEFNNLIFHADNFSSAIGSVATDGSSLPRFKQNSMRKE